MKTVQTFRQRLAKNEPTLDDARFAALQSEISSEEFTSIVKRYLKVRNQK
ncbi:MAG: hypothetical protein R3321_05650 [Nitrososphaeraceae archaeon]|nr:hypothetical protein [Nitrososphaeraceae archaeon]